MVKSTPANLGAETEKFVGQVQRWFGLGGSQANVGTNYLATESPPAPPPPPPPTARSSSKYIECRPLNLRGSPGPRPPPEGFALNSGERVDWVLQESEAELANQYLSALQAHTAFISLDLPRSP